MLNPPHSASSRAQKKTSSLKYITSWPLCCVYIHHCLLVNKRMYLYYTFLLVVIIVIHDAAVKCMRYLLLSFNIKYFNIMLTWLKLKSLSIIAESALYLFVKTEMLVKLIQLPTMNFQQIWRDGKFGSRKYAEEMLPMQLNWNKLVIQARMLFD
jgi:hypothetical protein